MHTTLSLLNHVLAATSPSPSSGSKGGSGFGFIFVLVLIFGVVYFLFLRPARNRQRAAAEQRRSVNVGDEVTTTSGMLATVVAVEDDALTLEIAPGVHARYLPAAILRVNSDEEPTDEDDASSAETTGSSLDTSTHEVIDVPPTIEPTPPVTDVPPAPEAGPPPRSPEPGSSAPEPPYGSSGSTGGTTPT